jgi:hypothetical protein
MRINHIGFLCMPLLLLTSCFGMVNSSHKQIIVSIATEVDQQVEGGMTVNTVKLGEVHLSPALFKVSIPPGFECDFYDITIPEVSEDPSLFIPWQIFQGWRGVEDTQVGMTEVEIRNSSISPHLEPGGIVFLVIQNNMSQIVHRLMIGDLYDPHHFFIQKNWTRNEDRFDGMYTMREVRERSEKGNPAATEFKRAGVDSGEVVYAGAKLFEVSSQRSEARVGNVLNMVFVEPRSLVAEDLNFQGEPVVIMWEPSIAMRRSKSQLDIEEKAAQRMLAEEVLIWSSPPGLIFKLDPETKAVELKNDLRSLGYSSFTWTSIEVGKSGVSVTGGSL